MNRVRAVVLAGGEGRRMGPVGSETPKPLIPFGGTSRLIDFSLLNARSSGLREVLVLSQFEERQLMDSLHLSWNRGDAFRLHFGPYDGAYRDAGPGELPPHLPERTWPAERGTADALLSKARHIFGGATEEVLVLHADHVYRFDYAPMVAAHRGSGAALTLAYQRIERRYVHLFGMVSFDDAGNLTSFEEKPADPTSDLVFAAFCLFDAKILHRYLERLDGTDWGHDISRDVIPAMLAGGERIRGYPVHGYWEDIGTVDRYHRAHLRLLEPRPTMRLTELPRTLRPELACRIVADAGGVRGSVVRADLHNQGLLENSVAFPDVRIGRDARVRDSVLLPGARVPAGAVVDSAVVLGDGSVVDAAPEPMTLAPCLAASTGGA
ncbi:sugar phosphate nucleotidyltransferase [Micromonospora sp. NPDC048898]|uniref:sugar phosphate nucleotidyltransferase n=1 Tax=Micromonospora sp. NPDC048898 TaxID=3364260 RepID=UPI00370FA448